MGRFSPNYGPQHQREERNPLVEALLGAAEGFITGKQLKADMAERASDRTRGLYRDGFRPVEDAATPMPGARPAFPQAQFPDRLLPTMERSPQETIRGFEGLPGMMRTDYALPMVDSSSVARSLDSSRYFGEVDERDAELRSRPGITSEGQRFVFAPERVAEERGMDDDRVLGETLRAIDRMRSSGELMEEDATDARLRARGITLPQRSGLSLEDRLALQDVMQQDRLELTGARGEEARRTRTTPPATAGRTSADPRETLVNQRYTAYLNAKDAYGNQLYTAEEALRKANADADVRFAPVDSVPADTGRRRRLEERLTPSRPMGGRRF